MQWMMLLRILMGMAALASLGAVICGLLQMSRARTDAQPCQGVVRQVGKRNFFGTQTTLTINLEEAVVRVSCRVPGRRPRATDAVPVLWLRGDSEAVAEKTIRFGQIMLILGFAVLALVVVGAVIFL